MKRRKRYRPEDLPPDMAARIVVHPVTGCWEWQHLGDPDYRIYGSFHWEGHWHLTHRLAYELLVEPIDGDLVVDHVYALGCRAKCCCNPAHLEAVRNGENVARATAANITSGMSDAVLRRIGSGKMTANDRTLLDAAWMLPFDLHPGAPAMPPTLRNHIVSPAPKRMAPVAPPPSPPRDPDPAYTTEQVAAMWRMTVKQIELMRRQGRGPAYVDVGGSITYRSSALVAHIALLTREERERRLAAAS